MGGKKRGFFAGLLSVCMLFSACGAEAGVEEKETEEKEIRMMESNMLDETENLEEKEEIEGIVCWGDSLTYGYMGEGVSYPAVLEQCLKEEGKKISVTNLGACGEDSITIAGRSGGIPYVLKEAVTIPAGTEPIEIDLVAENGKEVRPSIYTDVGINTCEIAGVKGILCLEKNGYTFVRNEAGEETIAEKGSILHTQAEKNYQNDLSLICIGTNGGYDDFEELIEQQNAIIASRIGSKEDYLIIGISYGSAEGMAEYDQAMYEEYGERYLNLRGYMAAFGLSDAGIEATEEDSAYMEAGMVPPSLKADEVHFNQAGYEVMGKVIFQKLKDLGYFSKEEEITDREEAFSYVAQLGAGINIGNSLDAHGKETVDEITEYETQWYNPTITEDLFTLIKDNGFQTVRIPVTWEDHMNEEGKIEEAWLERVKEVVTMAYEKDLYVILDVHHDTWFYPSYENMYPALKKTEIVWKQIADYFQDYDDRLMFEGFNEPRLVGTEEEWGKGTTESYLVINELNRKFVETVRNTGGNNENRYLLITAYRSGSQKDMLDAVKIPNDRYLIFSAHSYAPNDFAQDKEGTAEWSEEEEQSTIPVDVDFEWLQEFMEENQIPVILTEFGAVDKENQEEREAWCSYYVECAREAGIPYIWWDDNYSAGKSGVYGILDRKNLEIAHPDIAETLTE
ncbi:MAG: cellulase family glycosylhydrolase [Roseburia sp.]